MSSPQPVTGSRPTAARPQPQPRLSILSDDTATATQSQTSTANPRLQTELTTVNARYTAAMDYTAFRLPPANWLSHRHCDTPAIFRDTLACRLYWTDEQKAAIKQAFTGWRSPLHTFPGLSGYTLDASTRTTRQQQTDDTRSRYRQRHTLGYFVNNTNARAVKALDGIIMYGVHIRDQPTAQPFRNGPAHLH